MTALMPSPKMVDMTYVETIRSFLTRPYPVLQGSWSGDNPVNFNLSTFDPLKVYLNLPVIFGKLQGFSYLRAGLRFEVRINGTRFHYGQLVAAFHPLTQFRQYSAFSREAAVLTMYPGVTLDPGPSQIGVFTVPYVFPQHFISLTSDSLNRSLGTFYLSVLVPLRAVNQDTIPSVQYTVYVSLVDPVVNAFTAAPLSAPLVLQEQSADSATRVVPENMNFLATDINDISVRAGMQGDNRVDNDESVIGTDRSDMLLSTIYTKPNFALSQEWTSANPAGTMLTLLPVTPVQSLGFLPRIAAMSAFWRGSIRYHVRFVASGFHSGRVILSWDPAVLPIISLPDISNRMSMVVDLQQTTDVYFTIPYMSLKPWLLTSESDVGSGANGILYVNVLNPLSTPSGEPTSVTMLIWAYGSSDLEFALPHTNNGVVPNIRTIQEQCCDQPLTDSRFGNLDGSFSVPGKMVMGEKLTSIFDYLKKMAFSNQHSSGPFTHSFYTSGALNGPQVSVHLKWFSRMFVVSRGAIRYAAVAYADNTYVTPVEQYSMGFAISNSQVQQYGSLVVRSSTPNAIINVPYYCIQTFIPTHQIGANAPFEFPVANVNGSAVTNITWYIGAGADFMFSYLVPPE